jgi:protein-disulfide isomerase
MMPRMLFQGLSAGTALIALAAPAARAQDDSDGWVDAPTVPQIGSEDRVYGKAAARFSLIVWLDPECPYCKVLGSQPQHVVDASGGRVNLAVRLYPLPFHGPNAVLASTTALCVGDQAGVAGYYRFLAAWMARTGSNGRGIAAGTGNSDPVADLAATVGARDREALAGCTTSSKTGDRLARDMQAGELAGIEGTPAIALRDNRGGHTIMVSGAIGEDDMTNAIRVLGQIDDGKQPGDSAQGAVGGATR